MNQDQPFDINRVIADAKQIISNPRGYYQAMPKSGGFVEPLIFIAVMAAVMGLISAVLSLFSSSVAGLLAAGFAAIILAPIGAIIGAFIGAAILFVIWKLMGSTETYETAFRCLAAATALYPIVALLSIIPYISTIVGIAWAMYLMIEASVIVHGRERKTAQIVFGILGVLLILSNISSERAARTMEHKAHEMGKMLEEYQKLPADEAGKKMGEFLKGLEEGMGESAK